MVNCSSCRYFQPDTINAPAGMGRCMHQARHGYWHPDAKHRCEDFSNAEQQPQQERAIDPR